MPSETIDDNESNDDAEDVPLGFSDDFVERFAINAIVAADPDDDYFIIDFQRADASAIMSEDGQTRGLSGPLQSSVRVILPRSGARALLNGLLQYDSELEEAADLMERIGGKD